MIGFMPISSASLLRIVNITQSHALAMNKAIFIDTGMNRKAINGFLLTPIIILNALTSFRIFCRFSIFVVACTASIPALPEEISISL